MKAMKGIKKIEESSFLVLNYPSYPFDPCKCSFAFFSSASLWLSRKGRAAEKGNLQG